MALWILSGTVWVSRYQKGETKSNLDFLEQETVSGCGISWAISMGQIGALLAWALHGHCSRSNSAWLSFFLTIKWYVAKVCFGPSLQAPMHLLLLLFFHAILGPWGLPVWQLVHAEDPRSWCSSEGENVADWSKDECTAAEDRSDWDLLCRLPVNNNQYKSHVFCIAEKFYHWKCVGWD